MILLFIIAIIIISLGLLLLVFTLHQRKQFGSISGDLIYQDTEEKPEDPLWAKSIPLVGKPDYLKKENGYIIPIEVKTGKTPYEPYLGHIKQLMAYCFIVEEIYSIRPPGGYIRYPNKEFKLAYTDEARESVKQLVSEMLHHKKVNTLFECKHSEHQ